MKKIYIVIFIILYSFVNGNNYEILEDNGVLFFKYSKSDLINELESFLEKYKEILSKDFQLKGEKKYIEEIRFGKNYIDKTRYYICNVENNTEKCLFYMNGKKRNYTEKEILNKKNKITLTYDEDGEMPKYMSLEGLKVWFKKNKISNYRIKIKENSKDIGTITYIFDEKENLEKIEVSNPLSIKSTLYGEEVKEYKSSIGSENYYFNPDGRFIKKEMYVKYKCD